MKLAWGQCNSTVGAIEENATRCIQFVERACSGGADCVVFPEMALSGYPPEDLLYHHALYDRLDAALHNLSEHAQVPVIVGAPSRAQGKLFNSAYYLHQGQIKCIYHKQLLPNIAVFDEMRYFSAGSLPAVITIKGINFGIIICEDGWQPQVAAQAELAGANIILQLNGSPYAFARQQTRIEVAQQRVAETGLPLIAVNLVGGQDELVFDGHSFALDASGQLVAQSAGFEPACDFIDTDKLLKPNPGQTINAQASDISELYRALVLGVRDYVHKNNFSHAIIGLSGGIDSAVSLAIASDALGSDKVQAVLMPSQYTAAISVEEAVRQCELSNINYLELPIQAGYNQLLSMLAPHFGTSDADVTEENMQARLRGLLLMALSNKNKSLLLTTSNKSELAVGYGTIYGDMAGGYNPIKDIWKTQVYQLARYRNSISDVIPEKVITRAPSAELRPNQTDQDSLPDYHILDDILKRLVEHNASAKDIVAAGFDPRLVADIITLVRRNEYKRQQAAPGTRVSNRAFGKDWRYPITSGFKVKI